MASPPPLEVEVIWSDDYLGLANHNIQDLVRRLGTGTHQTPSGRLFKLKIVEQLWDPQEVVPAIRARWSSQRGAARRLWIVDIMFPDPDRPCGGDAPLGLNHLREVFAGGNGTTPITDMVLILSSWREYAQRITEIMGRVAVVWKGMPPDATAAEIIRRVGAMIDEREPEGSRTA